MDAIIYNKEGKEAGKITLPETVFGLPFNANLVHEVIVSMQANARAGTAHTKFRGEIRGGGKKPWKQKGTGRARHGSSRSPIWSGGGVAHGPRTEKDYSKKINRNVRSKALGVVLSQKLRDGEVVFLDSFNFENPTAKDARLVLKNLASAATQLPTKRKNAALIGLSERNETTELSFRNFGNVEVVQLKDMSPVDLLGYKYVVIENPEAAVKVLETRVSSKAKAARK